MRDINQDIDYYVFLLWETGMSIEDICENVKMTEQELREHPAIEELFNK